MRTLLFLFACLLDTALFAGKPANLPGTPGAPGNYEVKSPDGSLVVHIQAGAQLQWSADQDGQPVILPSAIGLQLQTGETLGANVKITDAKTENVNTDFTPINYKKSTIHDQYAQLTLNCKGDYSIIFRVYNDAVAYRFVTKRNGELIIKNEEANFNFAADDRAFIPIQWDYRRGKIFNSSFENLYREINLSQWPKDSLAFLPLLVDIGANKKVVILESDLDDYPGMYLDLNATRGLIRASDSVRWGLKGVYAPYPLDAALAGINYIPGSRAGYIAKTTGSRNFPWRVIAISRQDKDLLSQDIVQKLAAPPKLSDVSWIKPGQVAWDWWNNWNITHVDFKAGINTETYKYYIDFAAANHLQYIVMDEGWSNDLDLFKVSRNIDLQQIIDYGKQKGIGVILWATWYAINRQMDSVFPHYAAMGVKGFKIDFIDRDDQVAIASTYVIAQKAAAAKLLVDYHGTSKPTGLPRTWPNVIGYEGVKGLENFKWADEDQPRYVVSIPFIRMMAGPMDYTPGAMRNATKATYRPVNNNPMAKGTRCQQLAEYIVFDAPLQMLSDNPTIYMKEQECTDFIASIPTTFDETVPLDGKVGEYLALAHRKGKDWFVGAMTNWDAREITIDCSFLPEGHYVAEVFKDGVNADRDATDYKKETIRIQRGGKLTIRLAPGGGWAAHIRPV
ncbi:glycoside hydrolase family 97 protein [Puia dinghuensis]|uniref:Retaining alpha-galactosidase n=1 Tax=Puia dinghuensis TaxID=1792502 RepID=A0A8J2UD04_9BACT|nr:glycoside hydrolase family 97 protein [Puia dinghuensis]GGB00440.1 retaining alpha-galactosidase [Puia dinghuensis]